MSTKDKLIVLNLGCGKKKMKDAINVDIDEACGPDVIHDLSKPLPFEDNYADELHAYHIIEHFTVFKARDILENWYAVLKPNGLIILELPNVLAAINFLLEGIKKKDLKLTLNFGLSPIYGGPVGLYNKKGMDAQMAWREDPGQYHKWGYWPEYLATILQDIGFHEIKVMPPRTKPKEYVERDFRIEGRKKPNG